MLPPVPSEPDHGANAATYTESDPASDSESDSEHDPGANTVTYTDSDPDPKPEPNTVVNITTYTESDLNSDSYPNSKPFGDANTATDTAANPDPDLEPDTAANTVTYTEPDPISDSKPDSDPDPDRRRLNLHTCRPARGGGVSMRSWREEPTREPAHADALGRRLSPSRHKFQERASPIVYWPPFIHFR